MESLSFETKRDVTRITLVLVLLTVGFYYLNRWLDTPYQVELYASNTPPIAVAEVSPPPILDGESVGQADPSPSVAVGETEQIVKDIFGEHSDKAFKLLECENRSLNPKATNDNTKWGGVGVDRGLFQINDHWQGIRHEGKAEQFLYDPLINTAIAWRLYEDSGYNFSMWTCGKQIGI